MNSYSSIQSPFDFAKEFTDVLPVELTYKIFKFHNGLISPSALLIKNHMKENHMCPYTQLDYFFKHENFDPEVDATESLYDWWFITMSLNDELEDEDKYSKLWFKEVDRIRGPSLFWVTN